MGVGGIFFAQGWQKLEAGLTATSGQFAQLGAPMPGFWAAAAMLIELIGGTLLIAGLAVPAVGLLLFAEALAVFILTAGDAGLPLTGGSVTLIVALGAASVLLAVGGAGRVSVDHMVVIKRREAEEADDFAAEAEADEVLAALRDPRASAARRASIEPKTAAADPPAEKDSGVGSSGSGSAESSSSETGAKGPVTFPASGGESEDTAPKPRVRRTKRPTDETTESRSEPPPSAERGDTLVAGRRVSGKSAGSD
jgi:putative oxidoreductase